MQNQEVPFYIWTFKAFLEWMFLMFGRQSMSLWTSQVNLTHLCSTGLQTRLTIAEGHDEPVATNGDVLIFPDMVKYK
jgi:hypothetical protein